MKKSNFTLEKHAFLEGEIEKETFKKCRPQMRFYRLSFNTCYETIGLLCQRSGDALLNSSQVAFFIIMFRLIGSLQSIKVLTLKGYYYEANVLTRNFLESLGLCVYFKENPHEAEQWLHGKKVNVSSIELVNQMAKIFPVKKSDHHDKQLNRIYGRLCDYVHSNVGANLESVVASLEGGRKIISGEPASEIIFQSPSKVDKEKFDTLISLALAMVFAFVYLFKDYLTNTEQMKLEKFLQKQIPKFLNLVSA